MRLSLATVLSLALCAYAAPQGSAAPKDPGPNANIPPAQTTELTGTKAADGTFQIEPAPEAPDSQGLQKRVAPVVVAVGIAGTGAVTILAKIAIEIGADTIKNLGKWNEVRETFSKKTTTEMWARNPDYKKFPAAVCYNKGYTLQRPEGRDGLTSAKLELGQLHTDYDCMFMEGNNKFMTKSEGGYINLSYTYDGSRCTFDQKTGDLTCK